MTNFSTSVRTETCAEHGPFTATVIRRGDHEQATECPVCFERARRAADRERWQAARERDERARCDRLFTNSGVPFRFRAKGFESFDAKTFAQEKALRYAREFAAAIIANAHCGISAIFTGNVGTGKTHLACAIVRELCSNGVPARFETVLSAMRSIKDTYRRDSEVTETEAIEALTSTSLLVLDEVGVQLDSEHERTLFFEMLNMRYQECRSTLLLSNLTPAELGAYLGDRVIDRFRENGKVLAFGWESQRGKAR